tara:strand:+ start:1119 stop:2075 length:957 start_codon:yes stop_codon:yes gene_type:complete
MKLYNLINPKYWIEFFTFYGGGKGGGGGSQTVYQQQVPKDLVPYARDIAEQSQKYAAEEYIPYGGQRIAGIAPGQDRALRAYESMGASPYYPAAGLAALQSTQAGSQAGQFGAEQAAQYMSPYQQAVTDVAKRQATSEAEKMRTDLAGRAQRAGAFGGSRYGLMEGKLYSDLGTRLSDLQTKGSQAAFSQAQQQFERDRMARQQAAQLGLSGARTLADVGTAQQQAEMKRLQAMERAGTLRQAEAQRYLDQDYQDFLRQQDYPYKQLGFYSSMVRGLQPISPYSSQQQQPAPSPFSQALGLGLAGLGAYNMFGNRGTT